MHAPVSESTAATYFLDHFFDVETQRQVHDTAVAPGSEERVKPLFSRDSPSHVQAQCTITQALPLESADLIKRGAKDNQTIFFSEPDIKENADLIPQLKLHIPCEAQINERLFMDLKAELDVTLGPGNFAILGIEKGSVILKIALFMVNIVKQVCSAAKGCVESFKEKLEKIGINKTFFECIEKVRIKTFGCLKGMRADSVGISQVALREEIKGFIIGSGQSDDPTRLNAIIPNEKLAEIQSAYNSAIEDMKNKEGTLKEIIEQSGSLEEYEDRLEKAITEAKHQSEYEYRIISTAIVNKDRYLYETGKACCPNCEVKMLFHGSSLDAISSITAGGFRNGSAFAYGIGTYFSDSLDCAKATVEPLQELDPHSSLLVLRSTMIELRPLKMV